MGKGHRVPEVVSIGADDTRLELLVNDDPDTGVLLVTDVEGLTEELLNTATFAVLVTAVAAAAELVVVGVS